MLQRMPKFREFYSVGDAAELLSVSPKTIRHWGLNGRVDMRLMNEPQSPHGRRFRVTAESLRKVLDGDERVANNLRTK